MRRAELIESPGIRDRSDLFSSIPLRCWKLFARGSSWVLQGCRFAAERRPWGDAAGTQSRCATLRFAYGCSSGSCCAKRFLSNRPDSCLPAVVTVVSFPLAFRKRPSAASAAIRGARVWVAESIPPTSVSVVRTGHVGVGVSLKISPVGLWAPPCWWSQSLFCRHHSRFFLRRLYHAERGTRDARARGRRRPPGAPETRWGFRKWHGCPGETKPASHHVPKQAGAGMLPGEMWGASPSPAGGTDFLSPFPRRRAQKHFGVQGTPKVPLLGYPQPGSSLTRRQTLLRVVASHCRVPEQGAKKKKIQPKKSRLARTPPACLVPTAPASSFLVGHPPSLASPCLGSPPLLPPCPPAPRL